MKGSVIFGTGQAGMAMYRLMQKAGGRVAAFGDNNPILWGTEKEGIPVWPMEQVIAAEPEEICLAIVNPDAVREIMDSLRAGGYTGALVTVGELKARYDIRLATVRLLAEELKRKMVPGALAELGVYQGAFAAELNRMFPEKTLYLFDTFTGFDERDIEAERDGKRAKAGDFSDTSVDKVMERMAFPDQVVIRAGYFPDSLWPEDGEERFSLVSLDTDLYRPTLAGLEFFYPRLSPGGCMILDDYNSPQFPGVGKAVREFCDREGLFVVPLCDLHGTAVLVKPGGGR